MTPYEETRRAERERASEMSLGRDRTEFSNPPINYQAARIVRRFAVSDAVARLIAEHCFARRPAR